MNDYNYSGQKTHCVGPECCNGCNKAMDELEASCRDCGCGCKGKKPSCNKSNPMNAEAFRAINGHAGGVGSN